MTLKEITTKAGKLLPRFDEYENTVIRILVENPEILSPLLSEQLDMPTSFDRPFYEVEFRKRIKNKKFVGWELVGLCNGF